VSLTKKDIEEIMGLLEASRFDRLRLEFEGLKLELERNGASPTARAEPTPAPAPTPPPAAQQTLIPTPARTEGSPAEGLVEVLSPLLGVFYRAPKPGEPPFVEVGARVEEDTVIGIIEVMKLMNSARAGVRGEIVEILGVNGEMVEHGEVLMLVRPD
jgi:acetyl-CoA carboxylase biotin carboxyl carrier protein